MHANWPNIDAHKYHVSIFALMQVLRYEHIKVSGSCTLTHYGMLPSKVELFRWQFDINNFFHEINGRTTPVKNSP